VCFFFDDLLFGQCRLALASLGQSFAQVTIAGALIVAVGIAIGQG
jgi:hypothetical protein